MREHAQRHRRRPAWSSPPSSASRRSRWPRRSPASSLALTRPGRPDHRFFASWRAHPSCRFLYVRSEFPMSQTSAFGAPAADQPLISLAIERREPGPARRLDRDPLLRRLPLRPPHRARRVGADRAGRSCPGTRSSAGSARSAPRSRASRSATSPASAAWSTPAAPAPPAREGLEQYCENGTTGTYGGVEKETGRHDPRRLLERDRRRPRTSSSTSPTTSTWRRPRRCSAPASPPTRRCATGTSGPARRSAWSASAASATWR